MYMFDNGMIYVKYEFYFKLKGKFCLNLFLVWIKGLYDTYILLILGYMSH